MALIPGGKRRWRNAFTVSVDTADSPLLGSNPRRVGLIFSAPPTNRFTLSFGGTAVLDQGLTLYPAGNPLVLPTCTIGGSLSESIRAISAVAAQNVSGIEILEDKQ